MRDELGRFRHLCGAMDGRFRHRHQLETSNYNSHRFAVTDRPHREAVGITINSVDERNRANGHR